MKTIQTILMFLATPLLVAFTSQSARGFSLSFAQKGARDLYIAKQSKTYTQGNEEITISTTLSPPRVTEMPLGGTRILNNLLDAYSVGASNNSDGTKIWRFTKAKKPLRGNLQVLQYFACTVQIPCKFPNLPNLTNQLPPISIGVGAGIELNYIPGQGDTAQDIRWIQWINTNHSSLVTNHKDPGARAKYLDINTLKPDTPFYPGSNTRLADRSYRIDPLNEHYWLAEAYLVGTSTFNTTDKRGRKITETNVTIYNGISWGWKNKVTRRRKQPVPVPVPVPAPKPTPVPVPKEYCPPPGLLTKSRSAIVASSSSGGGGIGCVVVSPSPTTSPSPTPRPTPRPAPGPSPSPTPSPTISVSPAPSPRPAPTPSPWTPSPLPTSSAWTPSPWPTSSRWTPSPLPTSSAWTPSPWPTPAPWATATPSPRLTSSPLPTPSPWPTPTPWVTSPLGSTSSTVVVSTSTTIASPSPFQEPSSPAPSPRPAPALSPGGPLIRVVPLSASSNANAASLPKSSLFESSSKANTDYLTAISSDLLEDPELSSTDNSLNNANLAGVSRDLLENPELSSTDSNENQVNLAGISSDLLEDPELSSTDNDENNPDIGGISADLLEDPELSSTDSDENNADLADISADLLEDPELSSEDHNSEQVDLAGISSDLLEDPELSYLDDTLTAQTQKVSSKNTDDDALPAEAVPEPTTALGTLLAASVLPVIKRLKNRKNKE